MTDGAGIAAAATDLIGRQHYHRVKSTLISDGANDTADFRGTTTWH
jgi:hypothetical protein